MVTRIIVGDGEPDLSWEFFMMQAAHGAFRVPGWSTTALLGSVADKCGKTPGNVDEEDLHRAFGHLPGDPSDFLGRLTKSLAFELPESDAASRITNGADHGLDRDAVTMRDLLHDASRDVMRHYGVDHVEQCLDEIGEPKTYKATSAVALMLYALLLRHT